MTEPAARFPLLEHLEWAKSLHRLPRHHLGTSAVPEPPREIFDPDGPVLLDAQAVGERELAARVAARYRARAEEIVLCAGVSEGLYLAAASVLEPGDVVLVESPRYQSLAAVPRALGAEVLPLPRAADGALEPVAVAETFARAGSRRVAAVFVSDLHNPTGARLGEAALDALAEACRRSAARLVIDEVYRDADPARPLGTARERHPDAVVLSSLTKSYGLGGLRTGWLAGPESVAAAARRVQDYLSVHPASPSVGLALRVLEAADAIVRHWRPLLAANRAALARALAGRPGGFEPPGTGTAGTVAFPHRPGGPDTRAEAAQWLGRHEVAVVPGAYFERPQGVRLGLGMERAAFAEALDAWLAALGAAGAGAGAAGPERRART